MYLLTPNILMLGRNNGRSPTGPLCASNDSDKIIEQNANIMKSLICVLACESCPQTHRTT